MNITNKHGKFELSHKWLDNVRLRFLENQELSTKFQNLMKLRPSDSSKNDNVIDIIKNLQKRQKLSFSRMVQFHKKAIVCLRQFVHDSVLKQVFPSIILPQVSARLICVTTLVTLMPLQQI